MSLAVYVCVILCVVSAVLWGLGRRGLALLTTSCAMGFFMVALLHWLGVETRY